MGKANRRVQASKRQRNIDSMGQAFIELRKGSRTSPHRNLSKYSRADYRNASQRGEW